MQAGTNPKKNKKRVDLNYRFMVPDNKRPKPLDIKVLISRNLKQPPFRKWKLVL